MASYVIDASGRSWSSNFNEPEDPIRSNDPAGWRRKEALLDFGLNFLKHVLLDEKFIEEYPDAYEKRLSRKREPT